MTYKVVNSFDNPASGIERELASRSDQRVLRWFGHVGRMVECRMARRVLMVEVMEVGYEVDSG